MFLFVLPTRLKKKRAKAKKEAQEKKEEEELEEQLKEKKKDTKKRAEQNIMNVFGVWVPMSAIQKDQSL